MKTRRSKSNNWAKISLSLALAFALVLAVGLSWSPAGSNAQVQSAEQPQPSKLKVLIKTNSGDVVTTSQQQPSEETISELRSLLRRYPGTWRVDIEKGLVKNLKPTTSIPVTSPAKDFSLGFLTEFSNVFGLRSDETAYLVEFSLRERRVIEYRQAISGVPVEHSFITFSVLKSQLEQVTSRVYPAASRNLATVTPTLTKQDAMDVAVVDFRRSLKNADGSQVDRKSDLVVLPAEDSYFLTWKVVVDAVGGLDSYTYYIDAHTGRILERYSNLRSQESTSLPQQPTGLQSKEEASAVLQKSIPVMQTGAESDFRDKDGKRLAGPKPGSDSVGLKSWQTILSENFDTLAFPYGLWNVFDGNGSTGGELHWDDQNCVSYSPNWSLWPAAGGVNERNACTDNYVNNMVSWVTYGPFDLSGSTDALLEFRYNNVSELDFDILKWLVSTDGTNFHGFQTSGNSNGWQPGSLDFKSVPTLGNITGRSQVWIAFVFTTDSSVVSGKGPFVDDVSVKKMVSSSCTGVSGHVGGHIYGRNQNELQLKDFKNMKVVLNNTFAFDSHAVTNSIGNYSSSECSDYIRFELEGHGSSNFLKVRDCNNGTCPLGGDLLASPDFPFAPQSNFDWNVDAEDKKEVNVFWHVNEMHDWYRSLLGQDLMNYQMQAYVDYVDENLGCSVGTINAFYRGSNENMYFCPSDVSRESDVIYHEYTHGVLDHIPNYSLPYQDESGAMDEGLADYFAAVKNGDSVIGEGLPAQYQRSITAPINYADKCNAESSTCRSDQYFLRSTSPDRVKNDYGFVHHNSLVPSGALWNLRQNPALSASYVDRLIFDTLILRKPLTFTELLNGLIAQDGGSHEAQIRSAFAARGVTTSNCTYSLAPTSQIFIASASTGSFNVSTAAGCPWTAQSNVSWLTTSSSGSGNGTVNYSVAANTGNSRNGTITAGGQTFSVFQSAGNGSGCPNPTIDFGQTINTTLDTSCVFTGTLRYTDPYIFSGTAGQQVVISMSSNIFDTYLFLDSPNSQTIAQDDDGGDGTNARIPAGSSSFTLPTTGTYRIWATSYSSDGQSGSTGAYSLTLLDATSTVRLSSSSYSVNENAGTVTITVTRLGSTIAATNVNYVTSDIAGLQSCATTNGRASERCDYVTTMGTVRFAAGESSKTFTVPIIDDVRVEGNETFTVTLSSPTGATLASPSSATVTIVDNDSTTATQNPIDGVEFFILQMYRDILNRQPDSTGFQNWVNTLAPCPNGGFGEPPTSNCDRLHVASGFFQSDEFLNRGYFAFRFYMVSFNQRPTYAQFIPDMAQVGGPKSPAEEEASKVTYADAFVQRPQFLSQYPGLSGQPLANALLQTAGLPSGSYNAGSQTNGQILRGIAESSAAFNKFLTEGTVSILYFGFQRRDPDAIGYQNNLDTLNANPNNLRHMIFIFIYSTEYRQRFGP